MLEVLIIGGGFSSTIAAVMLAKTGYRIPLAARYTMHPEDFRAEDLNQIQVEALRWMRLLDRIVSGTSYVRHVALTFHGRLLGFWPPINDGIRYDTMVNAARALLPPCVALALGRVFDLKVPK